jgi:hypothetical protein
VAEVLCTLVESHHHYPDVQKRQALLRKLAERIAVNRTVAGVHFPIDSWAGAILGRAVGQIVLAKCGVGKPVQGYRYHAKGDRDFFVSEFVKGRNDRYGVEDAGCADVGSSAPFVWLWRKAYAEFDLTPSGNGYDPAP